MRTRGRIETTRALPRGLSLPIYFANDQWAVTSYGIECVQHCYLIEADRLDERRPGTDLLDWIVHLAEKRWVDVDAFTDAYRIALKRHRRRYRQVVTDAQIEAAYRHAVQERHNRERQREIFEDWMHEQGRGSWHRGRS